MANYIRLPNGAYYEAAEGQDYSTAVRDAFKQYPEAFGGTAVEKAKPKGGIGAAFGQGLENLISSGQTAFGAVTGSPEEAAQSALARQAKMAEKYPEQVSLERVKQAYADKGVLSAAGEALSQVPAAIAEQVPNLAATLGGARTGAALGSFAGPVGTVVGGLAGAAVPSLISQFGGNVERQAQEQKAAGQPIEIDRGKAGLAAVPQAALDVAGTFIPLGGKLISKLTGIPEKALLMGAPNAAKLAEERLVTTLAKGTATGVLAEVPTEIAQQLLERAQAGLSLTDESAMAEYGKTAYQVGLLGPLGAVGRVSEKSAARDEVAQKRQAELDAAAKTEAEKPLQIGYTPPAPPVPATTTVPPVDVTKLMEQHDTLRAREEDLVAKMAESPASYAQLRPMHKDLQEQIGSLSKKIEEMGGTTVSPEAFDAQATTTLKGFDEKLALANKELTTALDPNNRDYELADRAYLKIQDLTAERDAATKDIEQRRKALEEKTANLTQRGQTRELFPTETPQPTETKPLTFENIKGKPVDTTGVAETKEEAVSAAPVSTEVLKEEPKAGQETSKLDTKTLDLFTPQNIVRTAIRNKDERTLANIQAAEEKAKMAGLDVAKAERDRLTKVLDERLNLSGTKVTRTVTPEEYETNMRKVDALKSIVENPQGNAKFSYLESLQELAKQEQVLVDLFNERKGQNRKTAMIEKKLEKVRNDYNTILEKKVQPTVKAIEDIHTSMYKAEPAATAEDIAEKKKAESARQVESTLRRDKEGKVIGAVVSREAKTARRINKGDVRKEAEASDKMRNLARELGREDPQYIQFVKEQQRQLKAFSAANQDDKAKITNATNEMQRRLVAKAEQIGKTTPEYKATLKEQTAYFQETLGQTKQEVKSKRTGPETRDASNAPKEMRTASSEAYAAKAKEAYAKAYAKDLAEARKFDDQTGTAYRKRGAEGESLDAAEAQAFMDKVQKNLPENVKLVYAPTVGKIPVKLLTRMAEEGIDPTKEMVQGAVFSDGTVLVVGDQHANLTDLEETVAHELVGHYGIDTLIGMPRLMEYAKKTDLIKLADQLGGDKLVAEVKATMEAQASIGSNEDIQKLQALREIIAHTEEARITEAFRDKAKRWLNELVGMVRSAMRQMGFTKMPEMSSSDVFYALKKSRKAFADKKIGAYRAADGQIAFRTKRDPSSSIFAREPSAVDKFLGNVMGLAGRVQFIDKQAALSAAFKKGMSAGEITSQEALNAEFLLRFGEQRSMYAGQFMTNGRVSLVTTKTADGIAHTYESKKGVSLMTVAEALNEGAFDNDTQAEDVLTVYEAGSRANQVGWDKLNFENSAKAKAEYDRVMAQLKANPKQKAAVEKASKLYREYNAGLLDFLVETGAMTPKKATELKSLSYVPFYRVAGNGNVELMIDKEHPVRIGNIKDEPQLHQLVGDNKHIMPIFTSSVQNTFMLTGMGLRNQAVKESAFALRKIGIASRLAPGTGPDGRDVVRFKKNGEDHYVLIDTDKHGIPADLIIKGMEGIKTTVPVLFELMGIPADILRKFVTRNPVYALRQVVRDPLNAWLTTGTDAIPVLSSMKELSKMVAGRSKEEQELMQAGAITSNVFSGDQRDMTKFLKDISAGKSGWDKAISKLDAFALQGDAATRVVVYKDSLAKGMSKQAALLRTLESMNFSRRGVSPSMQVLSTVIPFFNAQIQGLDVLYRAFKGDMPFSEQLKIKEKLVQRGLMLAAGTMAYAMLMSDDEAYKRAKPEERYANWFVYVPGIAEPIRVPIPFELGYLFKALPEAIYNMTANDEKASKAMGGLYKLLEQSNPFALPQAVKPLTEAVLGKSFYGGDIESERERKSLLPTDRYRDTTTELSKLLGQVTGKAGVSPIVLDHLIRGYTGPLGIALVQLANPILNTEMKANVAEPTLKASKTPFIGGLFQPVEGRGTLDEAYDRMTEIQQTKGTYNDMLAKGNRAEAKAFAQENANTLAMASTSGSVQKYLGEIAKRERIIRASPTLTTEQKDAQLERLDQMKTAYARKFIALADRTRPQ
jgi:hypothetical protein